MGGVPKDPSTHWLLGTWDWDMGTPDCPKTPNTLEYGVSNISLVRSLILGGGGVVVHVYDCWELGSFGMQRVGLQYHLSTDST